MKVWVIICRTGCTCCSYENFIQGPYLSEEQALEVATQYSQGINNPLASQFAKYGRYHIQEWEVEVLPDGRWIYEDHIFASGFEVRKLLDY